MMGRSALMAKLGRAEGGSHGRGTWGCEWAGTAPGRLARHPTPTSTGPRARSQPRPQAEIGRPWPPRPKTAGAVSQVPAGAGELGDGGRFWGLFGPDRPEPAEHQGRGGLPSAAGVGLMVDAEWARRMTRGLGRGFATTLVF